MAGFSNRLLKWLIVSCCAAVATATTADTYGNRQTVAAKQDIGKFHQGLIKRYPKIEHISTQRLADLPAQSVLLFDVRESPEFAVSHLPHAIQISPKMKASELLNRYREQMAGKTVVFYCSLGERSSKLAEKVLAAETETTFNIANLEGGIFKWHNEQRSVVSSAGPTNQIHPFNGFWGRFLIHQDQITNP